MAGKRPMGEGEGEPAPESEAPEHCEKPCRISHVLSANTGLEMLNFVRIRAETMRELLPEQEPALIGSILGSVDLAIECMKLGDIDGAVHDAMSAMLGAWQWDIFFGMVPQLLRDEKRQAGTRKERWPELTEWIDNALEKDPKVKSPDLWNRSPAWISDEIRQTHRIDYRRFAMRVTKRRKARN